MRKANRSTSSHVLIVHALCIVASGKKKVWHTFPGCGSQKARDIYIGTFTRKCIDYAATFYPLSWCLLSAKYGFMMPEDIVYAPDCAKFNRRETLPLSVETLTLQTRTLKLDRFSTVVVLAGQAYLNVLRRVFPKGEIESPLLGRGGIGTMMSALSIAMEAQIPLA